MKILIIILFCYAFTIFAQDRYERGSIVIGGSAAYSYSHPEDSKQKLLSVNPITRMYLNKSYFIGPLLQFNYLKKKYDYKYVYVDMFGNDFLFRKFDFSIGLTNGFSWQFKNLSIYSGLGTGYLREIVKSGTLKLRHSYLTLPLFIGMDIYVNKYLAINIEPKYVMNANTPYNENQILVNIGFLFKIR